MFGRLEVLVNSEARVLQEQCPQKPGNFVCTILD